jgi:hypothetical protein
VDADPARCLPLRRSLPALVLIGLACGGAAPLAAEQARPDPGSELPAPLGEEIEITAEIRTEMRTEIRTTVEVEQVRMLAPSSSHFGREGRPAGVADELAGVSYRHWLSHGRHDLGIGIGSIGYLSPRSADGARQVVGAVPTLSIGWRHRMAVDYRLFADASGARGLGDDPSATQVTTRVGVEWTPAKSAFRFAHGMLGLQLNSGYRVSVRLRHGRPMLYLRTRF